MVQKKGDTFSKSRMQIDGTRGTRRRVREKGTDAFSSTRRRVPTYRAYRGFACAIGRIARLHENIHSHVEISFQSGSER